MENDCLIAISTFLVKGFDKPKVVPANDERLNDFSHISTKKAAVQQKGRLGPAMQLLHSPFVSMATDVQGCQRLAASILYNIRSQR